MTHVLQDAIHPSCRDLLEAHTFRMLEQLLQGKVGILTHSLGHGLFSWLVTFLDSSQGALS